MLFVVWEEGVPPPVVSAYPSVILMRDSWDDFGFRTSFRAFLQLSPTEQVALDSVKILRCGQMAGYTSLPASRFEGLPSGFVSLGQSFAFYERLTAVAPDLVTAVLEGLQDIVFTESLRGSLDAEPGFAASLLRSDSARNALADAPRLFGGSAQPSPVGLDEPIAFEYEFPDAAAHLGFSFSHAPPLPRELAVVIGYNGVGKTRLLANIAHVATAGEREASTPEFIGRHGRYVGDRPTFGGVIAVSYSAFDHFELPGNGYRSEAQNYTYCGLRASGHGVATLEHRAGQLKRPKELADEFHSARRSAQRHRPDLFAAVTRVLFSEPSFATVANLPDAGPQDHEWDEVFAGFSSGHKIAANIAVQLCAYLEPRTLVLIDEPELHLHPPLVAALVRAVATALRHYRGYGIIATHSPVVLQEVPASSVAVLMRDYDEVTVTRPDRETFAETVGVLTRDVFNLESRQTDWQSILRRLAESMTFEAVEALFSHGLSSQGRALVLSVRLQIEKEERENAG